MPLAGGAFFFWDFFMKLTDLIEIIENIAPPKGAASWDMCGIQVAAHRTEIQHLAVCLDPTPASVQNALDLGADAVLSHHPLLMQARMPARLDAYHQVLRILMANDVPLYAAHTSLDVNPDGPAGWLARSLKLQDLRVLEPTGLYNDAPIGFGLVGTLPIPCTLPQLMSALGKYINLETATLCGPTPTSIARIAYCTGSGASLLSAAGCSGADIYITGDVKYHTALETDMPILDVGHHSLEEEMMRHMCTIISHKAAQLTVSFVPSVSPLRPALAQS